MSKPKLLPSLLLTLASLVFLYSRVPAYIFPGEFIRPLIIMWSVLFILCLPAFWLTRDGNWAGILLIVVSLGFFSSTLFAYSYFITTASTLVLLWCIYKFLLKRKLSIKQVFIALNSVSLIAILLSLFSLYPWLKAIPSSYYSNTLDTVYSRKYVELDPNKGTEPDIYFIILDGYGRSDILQLLYDFDNSEFLGYLEQKGFIVPENSRSNYPKTVLSVSSTLNMGYIESFTPHLEESFSWWLMSPWIDHNIVGNSLKEIGYVSVSVSTDWSITDNPTSDYYLKSHPVNMSEFERYIHGITPLKVLLPVIQNLTSVPTYEAHCRSQMSNFKSLIESTAIPGPKFVFAHIILPHPPFVFSGDGSRINPDYAYSLNDANEYPGSPERYREQYIGQVQHLNSQLIPVIESILENSEEPPIIILQADHGPGMLTDFTSAANTCLAERFSTFSAFYLPGMNPETIPDDISNVNLFRIIFNEYFNTDLSILQNVQYYPRQGQSLYSLEDVTENIDHMESCSME